MYWADPDDARLNLYLLPQFHHVSFRDSIISISSTSIPSGLKLESTPVRFLQAHFRFCIVTWNPLTTSPRSALWKEEMFPQTLQACFHVGSKGFKYTDSPSAYWPGFMLLSVSTGKTIPPPQAFPGGHHYNIVVRVCWTQVYLLLPPSSQCNKTRTKRMNCREGGFCFPPWLLVGGEIYEGVFNLPDWKCESFANSIVPIFFHLKNIVPLWRTEDINSCIVGKPPQLFSITHNDAGI